MPSTLRSPRILCVTGTGTDIGKSSLSLAVALWARSRGLRAGYLKPVQCGSRETSGAPDFGDSEWILAACPELEEAGAVYTFPDPVSPHLAAERAGAWIDGEWILEQAHAAARRVDVLVVEGAGGAAAPMNREGFSLADIAASGKWPCLVAALPGLGTLHHTITTVRFLEARGASVAGFAFVQASPENPPLARDNAATLEGILKVPCFGMVPYAPGIGRRGPPSPAVASLLASALPGLDAWWDA